MKCDNCGAELRRKPSLIKAKNFCDKKCRSEHTHVTGKCGECGEHIKRLRCAVKDPNQMFCGLKCSRAWLSRRMTRMNEEMNPDRMSPSTRAKLRRARLNTGKGLFYEKYYGRHTHRVVAEAKIGRKLAPGEVVHHKDRNKRNNHPDNLEILKNSAEHARLHAKENDNARKGKLA